MPVIQGKILGNPVVYTDGWKGYDGLIVNGYDHTGRSIRMTSLRGKTKERQGRRKKLPPLQCACFGLRERIDNVFYLCLKLLLEENNGKSKNNMGKA